MIYIQKKILFIGLIFIFDCPISRADILQAQTKKASPKYMTVISGYDRINMDPDNVLPYLKKYLPENPVILEAGAYEGTDTVKLSKMWPNSAIYAFEPVPELYDDIKSKIRQIPSVKCFSLALSDIIGTATFHVSELAQNQGVASGSSSLLTPKETLNWDPHILFNKTIEVQTTTLDAWAQENNVQSIDLMWLDMQGAELHALKAGQTILDSVKVIYIEVEFVEAYAGQYLYWDVKDWLETKGFKLVATDFGNTWDWFWGNCVFVRQTK